MKLTFLNLDEYVFSKGEDNYRSNEGNGFENASKVAFSYMCQGDTNGHCNESNSCLTELSIVEILERRLYNGIVKE